MSYQRLFMDAIVTFHPKRYSYSELNVTDEAELFELFSQAIRYLTGGNVSKCKFKSWPDNFGYVIEGEITYAGTVHRMRIALSNEELKQSYAVGYIVKRTKDEIKYKLYLHVGLTAQKREVY